jgi:hypothetical protein
MKLGAIGGKIFASLIDALFALLADEAALVAKIVADVKAAGLSGDDARREAMRRFRAEYKGVLKDSLVNLLIEIAVTKAKGAALAPAE